MATPAVSGADTLMTGQTRLPRLALASLCAVLALSWPVTARAQVDLDMPPADNVGYLGFGWARVAVLGPDPDSPPQSGGTYPVVDNVDKCSPAEKAGLRVGDELMVVDGRDAGRPGYIFGDSRGGPGTVHTFTVRRGAELIELTVTSTEPLGKNERPADRCEEGRPSPS